MSDQSMTSDWDDLAREIDRWNKNGLSVEFWWRDDDAVEETKALQELIAFDVPLALAIIPMKMRENLKGILSNRRNVSVLQHGIRHENLAGPSQKKSEFPPSRSMEDAIEGLVAGRIILSQAFPDRFLPVFVPPWNRLSPALESKLGELSYRGLSLYGPNPKIGRDQQSNLMKINTHVDVIEWKATRSFIGTPRALYLIVRHLRAKREGRADPREPTGLLTHHLVHDLPTWRFLESFVLWSAKRGDVVWKSPRHIFVGKGA